MDLFRAHVLVCGGTGCSSSGSAELIKRFEEQIAKNGLDKEVKVVRTGCFGLCEAGPVVIVYPEGTFYSRIKVDDVDEIVSEHLLKGRIVQHLIYKEKADEEQHSTLENIDFYRPQLRLALRNCGRIDPENIDEYIAFDGYRALGKALTEMTPQQVIDEVLKSGLRGRGGAGFPTGKKWQFAAASKADQKYMVCNADEGDPGAFMDRSVLEGDPHAVLEAMAIGGYAIGASVGYIYVRAEYPIAVHRLQVAIGQAKEYGLLGENIFDTGFSFDLELRLGAGAFAKQIENARTPFDWLSTDPEVVDAYIADEMCGAMFSAGGYATLTDLTGEVVTRACAAKVPHDLPVLFVAGAEDPVGGCGKGVHAAAELLRGAGVRRVDEVLYPGMRHEILNEPGRAQVYADIAQWMEEHACEKPTS